jgi:hypothetical protein
MILGWLGYELTVLFALVAIFGFQFAIYVKIGKVEKIVSPEVVEEDETP